MGTELLNRSFVCSAVKAGLFGAARGTAGEMGPPDANRTGFCVGKASEPPLNFLKFNSRILMKRQWIEVVLEVFTPLDENEQTTKVPLQLYFYPF